MNFRGEASQTPQAQMVRAEGRVARRREKIATGKGRIKAAREKRERKERRRAEELLRVKFRPQYAALRRELGR